MATLPPQEDLKRRLRAGRVLADLTINELAERVDPDAGLGERTLRKLESGETQLRAPLLRELAEALDLPYEWFTVPSIAEVFGTTPSGAWRREIAELRDEIAAVRQELAGEESNGGSARTSATPSTTAPRRAPRGTRQVRTR